MKCKKLLAIFLSIIMIFSALPFGAITVNAATSGTTGSCWWSVSGTTLTIGGYGNMENYTYTGPWGQSIQKVVIKSGVTNIGNYAFWACSKLTTVIISESVKSIGTYAFRKCTNLSKVTLPKYMTTLGEGAFEECENITSIEIPNGITTLKNTTFKGCTNLSDVTIPNSVASMGNSVFGSCINLKNIAIPYGVKSMGNFVFYNCSNLTNISLPDNMKSIGEYAFIKCKNLKSIELPEKLTEIGQGAFEECESITTINIPDGVSTLNNTLFKRCYSLVDVKIPSSVTFIGNTVFGSCTNLKSVILPEGIKSIGKYTFYGCENLTNLTIPSGVTTIGEHAFSLCSKLSCIIIPESVTSITLPIFYKTPNRVIYGYSGSYVEGFAKENYIPFKLKHTLNQMVASPNTLGADFIAYGSSKTVSNVTASQNNGNLSVSKNGYYSVNVTSHTLENFKKLALVPTTTKSNIAAVHCKGTDILANKIVVKDTDDTIDLRVYVDGVTVNKYQLLTSPIGWKEWTVISESTNGVFTLYPAKLPTDSDFYIRIVDSNNKTHSKLKIQLDIQSELDVDFEMGDLVKISVPDDVPLIGGSEIEINIDDMPVTVNNDGDSIIYALGVGYDFGDKEFNYKNFSKEIDDITNGLTDIKKLYDKKGIFKKQGKVIGNKNDKGNVSVMATGYAEFKRNSKGELDIVKSKLVIAVENDIISKEWQYIVWSVPIVVKFKMEVGATGSLVLGFDSENSKIRVTGDIELTLPKLTLSGGIGVKKLGDVSVYGSAKNIIYTDFRVPYTKGVLSGELGVSAKALIFSVKQPILSGDWEYFNSLSISSYSLRQVASIEEIIEDESNYSIERSYLESQSGWLSYPVVNSLALDEEDFMVSEMRYLQTSVYEGAKPQTITLDNGYTLMVWTSDVAERTIANHTACVWSLYDPSQDCWTEPQIIDDDATADFNPVISGEGENIYVAWTNSNTIFENEPTMEELASCCEIKVSKFDFEQCDFTNVKTITNDDDYDGYPSIFADDEKVYISWISNDGNDILSLSGENTIEYAVIDNSNEITTRTFITLDTPIISQNIGCINDKIAIAYIADTENTENSLGRLFCGNLGEEVVALSDGSSLQYNPVFAQIDGQQKLLWCNNNQIVSVQSLSDDISIEIDNFENTEFSIISGNGQSGIVYSKVNSGDIDGSNIYAYIHNGEEWSDDLQITESNNYCENVSGYIDANGKIHTVFTEMQIEITEDSLTEVVNLCDAIVLPHYDIELLQVEFENSGLVSGDTMPVTAYVRNNGLSQIEALEIIIKDNNENTVYNNIFETTIGVGNTSSVQFDLILPEVLLRSDKFYIVAKPYSYDDANLLNNEERIEISTSNIALDVEKIVSGKAIGTILNVTNNGQFNEIVTLNVRKGNEQGEVLSVYALGELAAGEVAQFKLDAQFFREFMIYDDLIFFEITCNSIEKSFSDNTDYIIYGCETVISYNEQTVPYYYDFNDDGKLDLKDLVRLKKMLVSDMEKEQLDYYDISGDMSLNAIDIIIMRDKLIELF